MAKHSTCGVGRVHILIAIALVATVNASRPVIINSVEPLVKEPQSESPWFCHDIDCPPFDSEDLGDGLELRRYPSGLWASTNVSSTYLDTAINTGFYRLFGYISGANEGGVKIEMTAPVRARLTPGPGPFCDDSFTISFFLPLDYQGDGAPPPPAPSKPDVFIEATPATSVYLVSYGGWSSEEKVLEKAQGLVARLDELGRAYDASHYFFAGYDPPFRLIGRHNEVWVPALAPATHH
mmetsp:Transcript_9145/g.22652  ORF Transcript_9145/g.22652 Transcript_9145/m.22652 type:complete len:237 (-) Transcript_9145:492-1202(-)|eukprot:CAMPEP_0202869122 /NCGR_PEP_ID=MMETSP1391-20130828/11926_1 /ASSEMBLY_ACC=CAM_ASM_000867 /TAXON_ID=1034604 /ORGANISM="Chlamydomonas leiostraca, Strain SAG 11-49" /LENGTH=236 /DNA_ID=CAMNT_0049549387 /DNA_START=59 /DNA_END=769 /DNA_ORIENTATION=+